MQNKTWPPRVTHPRKRYHPPADGYPLEDGEYDMEIIKRTLQCGFDGVATERVTARVHHEGYAHIIEYYLTIPMPLVVTSLREERG